MIEQQMVLQIKALRTKLNLLPSHVDILGGVIGTTPLKEIERKGVGPRVLLESYLALLSDYQNSCERQMVPTEVELWHCLRFYSKNVVVRWHRGRPIGDDEWEGMRSEVQVRALKRMKNFKHGGKKNICEFVYMSCYWSLRDIQNEAIKRLKMKNPPSIICEQCNCQFSRRNSQDIRCEMCKESPHCLVCKKKASGPNARSCGVYLCRFLARVRKKKNVVSEESITTSPSQCITKGDHDRIVEVLGRQVLDE